MFFHLYSRGVLSIVATGTALLNFLPIEHLIKAVLCTW